jgi:hypothetical protein
MYAANDMGLPPTVTAAAAACVRDSPLPGVMELAFTSGRVPYDRAVERSAAGTCWTVSTLINRDNQKAR